MKKTAVSSLFYALFLILGHGSHVNANAQNNGLNPYDGSGMKNGTNYARCDYDAINDKVNLQNLRKALNSY